MSNLIVGGQIFILCVYACVCKHTRIHTHTHTLTYETWKCQPLKMPTTDVNICVPYNGNEPSGSLGYFFFQLARACQLTLSQCLCLWGSAPVRHGCCRTCTEAKEHRASVGRRPALRDKESLSGLQVEPWPSFLRLQTLVMGLLVSPIFSVG